MPLLRSMTGEGSHVRLWPLAELEAFAGECLLWGTADRGSLTRAQYREHEASGALNSPLGADPLRGI